MERDRSRCSESQKHDRENQTARVQQEIVLSHPPADHGEKRYGQPWQRQKQSMSPIVEENFCDRWRRAQSKAGFVAMFYRGSENPKHPACGACKDKMQEEE
jgi:hypothetical protein